MKPTRCERAIVAELVACPERALLRKQIAQRTGYRMTGGCFQTAMQTLIERKIISSGPLYSLL